MKHRRARRLLWIMGGVVLLLVGVVAVGLYLVDTPAVQAELQRRLSQALAGQVTWQSLDVGLLPAPGAELKRVRVEVPGKLSVSADEAKIYLRLWPLLRGSPEVSSVTVMRPQVLVTPAAGGSDTPLDPMALYRAAAEPAAKALQDFAPDMTLSLEQARVEIGTDFALRDLRASARTDSKGVSLQASTGSNFWKRLTLDARLEYADLAARVDVEVDNLRARLRTDAKTRVEGDVEVDLAQALALARIDAIESAEGRISAKVDFTSGSPWTLQVDVVKSDAALKLAALPWKIAAHSGQVSVAPNRIRVAAGRGAVGDSTFENAAAQIELEGHPHLVAASANAKLLLEQWFPWLKTRAPLDDIDSLTGSVDVALTRLALRFDRPQELDFDATATPRKVSAALKMLPGPVSVDGGSVRAGPAQIALTRVGVEMLDTRTMVSGNIGVQKPGIELALSDGTVGEKLLRWALEQGQVPARFEPKTPLRLAAQRIAWAPKRPLEIDAVIGFQGGPQVALALASRPQLTELRRVAIKHAASDAVLSATIAADLIQAGFSGRLEGRTIAAMLRQPPPTSGSAQGDMRVTIDRRQPERTVGEGSLRIEALDLSWLAGRKVVIERADLSSERDGLRISGARFGVEDQVFDLRAEGRRTDKGPVIDARIESKGVVLDRLLPPVDPNAPKKEASPIWPLPVTGRVEVASGFVQYKTYRIEPFDGTLALEPQRARLEVKQARMCGVSFPMEVEARPNDTAAWVHLRMKGEPLERAVPCLTGGTVDLSGSADLTAELHTQGQRPHLLRDMTGTLQAEVRQGHVKKFALLGNILSYRGIASFGDKAEGFPYRSMIAKGHFERGSFMVDEAFFDSDAVRLAASGRVDMLAQDSQLTVLVGLLTNVDRVAGAIPIIGDIFGGSMTALPVSVTGDIRNPTIVPLGPRAVTHQLLGIFERTLKLPTKLIPGEAKP